MLTRTLLSNHSETPRARAWVAQMVTRLSKTGVSIGILHSTSSQTAASTSVCLPMVTRSTTSKSDIHPNTNDDADNYHRNSGTGTMRTPFEFPEGFRMIAGDMFLRAPREHSPTNKDNITQWICHESPAWNQGNSGGFPDGVTSCTDYPYFNGAIHFPHCWNGKDYNAAKPYAHMSYPVGDIQNGPCPDSHPTRLPHIMMENDFDLSGIQGQFQENTFVLANGDPTGYSWHADFVSTPQLLTSHSL